MPGGIFQWITYNIEFQKKGHLLTDIRYVI
jgi:hypothetical protein